MRVFLIEDDARIRGFVQQGLEKEGATVHAVETGTEALEVLLEDDFDAAILDLGLPDIDGIDVLRELRSRGNRLPVLVLTARDAIDDRVNGLDAGADDYLVKPFALVELLARLRALTRRTDARPDDAVLRIANLTADLHDRRVARGDRKIDLSPREFALLTYLMRHRDQIVTRAMIAEHVWDQTTEHFSNVIDVYMGYLRKKIDQGQDERLLHTVRGAGYRLSETP